MSYILDALRKADAERERGSVPGIHAQPVFAGAPATRAQQAAWPAWAWAVVAAAVALTLGVAGLAWTLLGNPPSRGIAEPVAPARVVVAPAPATVAAAPVVAPAVAPPAETIKPAPATVAVVRRPKPAAPVAASASKAAAKASAAAASGAADSRIYAINELPEDIRNQLPALSVGGSMYSTTPADRIVIINGQVLHEGDAIAPGLVLQQIRLKAAVLVFKGYRYAIAF